MTHFTDLPRPGAIEAQPEGEGKRHHEPEFGKLKLTTSKWLGIISLMSTAISEDTAARLREWAARNDAVASLWLFGSRAKGAHRPESDYDIAIELKPKKGDHDWAFANYVFQCDEWKTELKEIVMSEVDLVAFRDDLQGPFDPREHGIKFWPQR